MKKVIAVITTLFLTVGVSLAGAITAMVEWDPPTHRVVGDVCSESGTPLTPEEVVAIQYTVQYREKGASTWNTMEVGTPRAAIVGLSYNKTYQVTAAGHFEGQTALCVSDVFEFSTGPGKPPTGCSRLRFTLSE